MEHGVADEFDPYYTWLGIRPEEQPADHYRLIGLRQFEGNADVISNALDQKMQFLRTMQVGKRSALSQKLLNEISAAGGCLLDPQKKQAYDKELKAKEAAQQAVAQPKIATARPLPKAAAIPRAVPTATPRSVPIAVLPQAAAPAPKIEFSRRSPSLRSSTPWKLPVMVAGILSLVCLGVIVVFASGLLAPGENKVSPEKPGKYATKPSPEVTPSGTKRSLKSPEFVPAKPATPTKNNTPLTGTTAQAWWKDPSHAERLLALQIGTTAYAELPDSASRSTLSTPLTAELWLRLKLKGEQPVQILGTLLGGEGVVRKGWGLFAKRLVVGDKPKDQLYVEFWKPTGDYIRYPVTLPDAGEWHHIALVFEPEKSSQIFIDGRPREFPAEKNLSSSQRNLVLGAEMQLPGVDFQAEVCGLRVSEGARYSQQFTPPSPLDMKPDEATFATVDCRLYQPAVATSGKAYPWLYGAGKFDPQSKRIVNFQPLRYGTARQWQGGKKRPDNKLDWIALDPFGGCPGGGPDQLAIRRWVAPADGEVTVSGRLRHFHSWRAGDGVKARIVSSNTGSAGEWRVFFQDVDTPAQGLKVQAGDTIDFVVDCERNSDCDIFEWIVDLKLVDAEQRAMGTWNSARDFRVIPAPPQTASGLREPVRNKAQWIPLEDFAIILRSTREAGGDQAQLVVQYAPAAAPSTKSTALTLKSAPVKPGNPLNDPFIPSPAVKKPEPPDAAALAKAKAEVVSAFGTEVKAAKTPKLKQELAQKMFAVAKDTPEPPTRFALLDEVRRLAVEGKDSSLAMSAVEKLGEQFEIDVFSHKVKLFESLASEGLTPVQRGEILSAACDLGYEALDAEKFEALPAIVTIARSLAAKAITPESKAEAKDFFDSYAKKNRLIDGIKKAEQTLATAPDEPGANLTLGLYYFFTRGDARKGLPLLAKGSDQKLAAAAKARERNLAQGVVSSLEEADAWFEAIASVPADYKPDVQKQALQGYGFLASAGTGLEKVKAEKRRNELTTALAAAPERAASKRIRLQDLPETAPGMIGRLLINGRDAGVLLTYQPSRDLEVTRLTAVMTQAKATVGRLVLEGTISCPADMFVRVMQNSQGNDGTRIVLIDGKPANDASGNAAPRSGSIPLAAGNHVVRWVYDFDSSSTPRIDVYSDMGGRLRRLEVVCPRAQNYEARKPPTKEEINLSN